MENQQPVSLGLETCLAISDQSVVLISWWLILVACLLVGLAYFALKRLRNYAITAAALLLVLLVARVFFGTNDCGHGGLFSSREEPWGAILIIATSVVYLAILGHCFFKSRNSKKQG